jgi:DNA-binding CsgD family transcriptional regulator
MNHGIVDRAPSTELDWMGPFKYSPLFGVLIFDSGKNLIFSNQAGQDILNSNDGLALFKTNISASSYQENQQLQQIMNESADATSHHQPPTLGGNLLISRPSGKRHYNLQVTPNPVTLATTASYPAIIVLIQDFERQPALPIEPMKNLYNLTTSEALVAAKITQGKSLELCAKELGHTISTSRNLLKRVFAKTRTSRQNELVSLLLSSPLAIQPPP